jgi:hypothetical protein
MKPYPILILSIRRLALATAASCALALAAPVPAAAQAAPSTMPAPAGDTLRWTFGSAQSGDAGGWTAERGSIAQGNGELRLQPDANRRLVLLSPAGLPDAARDAQAFVLGVTGTGLQRVRIQARRDARGGWITIADAQGAALRKVADGYAVKRTAGGPAAPIERLRVELQFRTTNPRALTHVAVVTAPR